MSFPLRVGGRIVPDPPALAALVRQDAGTDSGTVIPGQRPADWLMDLVDAGALERRLAIGLTAALLQHPEAVTICEGARLAARLGEGVLGAVLIRALDGHDTGLLLRADPTDSGASVEDTLIEAACRLCNLEDPLVRRTLLERMRHAGLKDLELPVLFVHGDAEDLEYWLPAVLAEGVSEREELLIADRIRRSDDGSAIIIDALRYLPELSERIMAMVAHQT